MFCGCRADYQNAAPNTSVCPVCLGMPGVLPVMNRKAIEYTIATGLALDCEISAYTKFDRKNYPYPDLMKGYQISQYDLPIAVKGLLEVECDGYKKQIGITRVHLEEDVAKLQHVQGVDGERYSLVDVNRSGVALMEIVGEPDIRSPEEARQYLLALRSILQYIGVTTGNMEEGSFRCDANVSIRPVGTEEYMARAEVKNMNSFRSVFNALEYEVQRQQKIVKQGGRVIQETRGWVDGRGITVSQRTKEYAHDYRYFPEPDLPPLRPDRAWVEEIRESLPELPVHRKFRIIQEYGLSVYDATLITETKQVADFFESTVGLITSEHVGRWSKPVSNWILGELTRLTNRDGVTLSETKFSPDHLAELVKLVDDGTLSTTLGKAVLETSFETGKRPREVVAENEYTQISDVEIVEKAVQQVIDENLKAVTDFVSGKETAAKFLLGQVMRLTKGKANPVMAGEIIRKSLNARVNGELEENHG